MLLPVQWLQFRSRLLGAVARSGRYWPSTSGP